MIGNPLLLGDEGYQIQRSLRFRSSASAYLNRTPASASNRRTWTWSGWVKRGALGVGYLFGATTDSWSVNWTLIYLSSANALIVQDYATTERFNLTTTMVFREPSAWYHLVVAVDTTQATASNRIKIYVNGVQVTALNTAVYPTQNLDTFVDNNVAHQVNGTGGYFDGYIAELNFIDGQALTPSSFGAINAVTGVWSATRYNGTYGTNGFYLNFTDNSAATAATIGKDYSGNGNNWTPNNISVTAGDTYDSMLDAPLGAGGGERGNYAVLNPLLSSGGTTANANLQVTTTVGVGHSRPTMAIPASGKWYCEFTAVSAATSSDYIFGIVGIDTPEASYGYNQTPSYSYSAFGEKIVNNSFTSSFYSTFTNGDIIGCAVNLDGNEINWYKNGTLAGSATSIANGSYFWMISDASGSRQTTTTFNAGQRPFSYTPPTGFKALHTGNLAAPVIALPAQNMAATTYTGTGATQSISNAVNSVSMQPDWVWFKRRGAVENHWLTDSVRGSTKGLFSNLTDAEATRTDQLTSFNSNGFTLGADAAGYSNVSGQSYVAWQWKAGGTAVTNTAGSITSSVSSNTTAGFSVVTYTGTGSLATVGHGLGVAPAMMIIKTRSAVNSWVVYHQSFGNTKAIYLNLTGAADTNASFWNNTSPTSSVLTVNTDTICNQNGTTYVGYCFAAVAGYSAFGSYTGNGSADGPFVYTGFRPRYVMIKGSSFASNWFVIDTSRSSYNVSLDALRPNLDGAETSTGTYSIDILSNGFKLRTSAADSNTSSATFIYAAFAENPFRNSLAR